MPREIQEPTLDQRGDEVHPAFGHIRASRVSSTPGAVLFDSEIPHGHYMTIEIRAAHRSREINHDWIHAHGLPIVEIAMSEAQWASFVSSPNTSGVPCTIQATKDDPFVPGLPYQPRLAQSMDYAHEAAQKAFEEVKKRFEEVKAKPTKANIRSLEIALDNAVPNIDYAAKTMSEHVENVVTKARADVEAMVARHAQQLGIDAGNITAALEIEAAPKEGQD